MVNRDDMGRFAVERGSFEVGEAVYADEQVVAVRAYWEESGEMAFLVFESDPDAMESSASVRAAQSWSLWIEEGRLRKLLSLTEFMEKPSGD